MPLALIICVDYIIPYNVKQSPPELLFSDLPISPGPETEVHPVLHMCSTLYSYYRCSHMYIAAPCLWDTLPIFKIANMLTLQHAAACRILPQPRSRRHGL
jgi:hypothetical protein